MSRYYQNTQAPSETLPTNPTDADGEPIGLLLSDMRGFRLTIQCEEESETIDGTGVMICAMWHPELGAWFRNPDLDVAVSGVTGVRGRTFQDVEVHVPDGVRIYFFRILVGTSLAGDLIVRLDAIPRKP